MPLPQIIALTFCILTVVGCAIALRISRRTMTDEQRWRAKRAVLVHTDTAPDTIAKVVRWKLSDPRFTQTVERTPGRRFHTRFRPDPSTLSVKLHIHVTPSPSGTALAVRCFPEWFADDKLIALYHTELRSFVANVCSTVLMNHS